MPAALNHHFGVAASTLSSTLGLWLGTGVLHAAVQPPLALTLYDMEGSASCRSVRVALTALGLDVDVRPCPHGGQRFCATAQALGAGPGQPLLLDPNAGCTLAGAPAILTHLFPTYAARPTPPRYRAGALSSLQGSAGAWVRGQRGTQARGARAPQQPLDLWSFESSPFSRLVRERLCELELPYTLHNLGKEQLADLGPASLRVRPGPYRPKPGGKRALLLARLGRIQLPYLEDPNTQTRLFESAAIIDYLEQTYAL